MDAYEGIARAAAGLCQWIHAPIPAAVAERSFPALWRVPEPLAGAAAGGPGTLKIADEPHPDPQALAGRSVSSAIEMRRSSFE